MQVADAVLRPPREREDRLVRPRVDREVARILRSSRGQRDPDQQVEGRMGTGPEAVDVPALPVDRPRASSRRIGEPHGHLHFSRSVVGPEQPRGVGRDQRIEAGDGRVVLHALDVRELRVRARGRGRPRAPRGGGAGGRGARGVDLCRNQISGAPRFYAIDALT